MIKSMWKYGQHIYIRRDGQLLKRVYVDPFNEEYFVGTDENGDNEICSWNLIYGEASKTDPWVTTIGELSDYESD
jgi:hypothetical protein